MKTFRGDLRDVLNAYNVEGRSNTPDFILALYLERCLENFDAAITLRDEFYAEKMAKQKEDGVTS